jgi:hypothetical protein
LKKIDLTFLSSFVTSVILRLHGTENHCVVVSVDDPVGAKTKAKSERSIGLGLFGTMMEGSFG